MSQNYLLVFLLKPAHGLDASNNGVSNIPHANYYVPCEDGPITEEDLANGPKETTIVLEVARAAARTKFRPKGEQRHTSFGGCFLYTSDGRFRETYGDRPIHLHDRIEG